MNQRTIAIGDIHGALKALQQLIPMLQLQQKDKLIFLGDYVDGWSQPAQVVAYLMELEQQYGCIFIRGNHDVWCADWLATGHEDETWLQHGGLATIASYSGISDEEKQRHIDFFSRLQNYYADGQKRLFIHAGFTSMHGPTREANDSNCYWDRTLWEMAISVGGNINKYSQFYPKRLLLYSEIFIGHTPTLNYDVYVPMQGCNVWNIDTGAAFYGRLSAMDINTKQYWQSDIVQTLYPNEKGRNK